MQRRLRIVIIANKTWEAAPLLVALFSKKMRPDALVPTARLYDPEIAPAPYGHPPTPRAELRIDGDTPASVQVWCIEDWMDPHAGGSNTPEKVRLLPRFLAEAAKRFGGRPDVIVAFGTAGIPGRLASNGCVAVGSSVFVHDPYAERALAERTIERLDDEHEPMWTDARLDHVLASSLPKGFFRAAPDALRHAAEARFVKPPVHAADPLLILAGHGFASVGTVNVTDYDDYVWADARSLAVFRGRVDRHEVGSIETTHGLIRLAAEDALGTAPCFLYISGLTDTLGYFDMEVTPRQGAQNLAAAHNAGVTTAWLLPEVARQVAPLVIARETARKAIARRPVPAAMDAASLTQPQDVSFFTASMALLPGPLALVSEKVGLLVEFPDSGVPFLFGDKVKGRTGELKAVENGYHRITLALDPTTFCWADDPTKTIASVDVEGDLTIVKFQKIAGGAL